MSLTPEPERCRAEVAALQAALDANDAPAFRHAYDELSGLMQQDLTRELKRLTADAQSALARFSADARLDALAGHEVPDARKRLTHVVNLTDEAAHRTLDLVEQSGPLVDESARGAARLLADWNTHVDPAAAVAAAWPERAVTYLKLNAADTDKLRGNLSQLLLAQGYQDITGQIIRSVIELVDELEQVLGQLVQIANGDEPVKVTRAPLPPQAAWERGLGPQVVGVSTGEAVTAQDDIDALISQMAGGK